MGEMLALSQKNPSCFALGIDESKA